MLRQITYDLVKNHYASKVAALKKAVDEHKGKKKKSRRSSAPNTRRGMRVDEQIAEIKVFDVAREKTAKKKAENAVRRKKASEAKVVEAAKLAAQARALVADTSTSVDARIDSLRVPLMAALLRSVDIDVEKNAKRAALIALMRTQFTRSRGGQNGRATVFGKWKHAAPTL